VICGDHWEAQDDEHKVPVKRHRILGTAALGSMRDSYETTDSAKVTSLVWFTEVIAIIPDTVAGLE
jgi:hypothetical protein